MKLKFFDFEVFKNWWCVVVSDEEDEYQSSPYNYKFDKAEEQKIKSKMRVYSSDMPQAKIDEFKQDIKRGIACGYNIKGYDLIILNGIMMNFTPHQLYVLSELIINKGATTNKDVEHMRIATYAKRKFQGCEAIQDLMDDSVKGLKDKEAAFGMDIRETTVPFDKEDLTEIDKEQIIYYCKHDVYALHVQYVCMSKPYIDTKLALCKTYNMPETIGYQATNAVLSGKVLGAERVHGTTIVDPTIRIYQPRLKEYIEKWVPADVVEHLLTKQAELKKVMFNNDVVMADGGLHSTFIVPKVGREQGKLYIEADDEWGLFNVDASSCYPSCMIFCGAMSRAVKEPQRFEALFKRRLALKQTPKSQWTAEDKLFVPAAKLVLNTTYGAMGNEYLPLYDDYMRSKTCRIGQLILLAVAHSMCDAAPELKVIQTNTDGILVYCKRSSLPLIEARVHEFEELSGFTFDIEEDKKLWQLNVNNYIAQSTDNSLKLKGGSFVTEIWQRGTNRLRPLGLHVIAKAQIEYYVNGKNPIEYLLDNENVNDMCLVCTKGGTYKAMVHKTASGDIELGKVGRVMAVTSEEFGVVKKQKTVNGQLREDTCAQCPPHALIMNDDLANYVIEGPRSRRFITNVITNESWPIDYSFYVEELESVLNIKWFELHHNDLKQITKFDLGGV